MWNNCCRRLVSGPAATLYKDTFYKIDWKTEPTWPDKLLNYILLFLGCMNSDKYFLCIHVLKWNVLNWLRFEYSPFLISVRKHDHEWWIFITDCSRIKPFLVIIRQDNQITPLIGSDYVQLPYARPEERPHCIEFITRIKNIYFMKYEQIQ